MQDFLIYGGLLVNVIGALMLAFFAIKRMRQYKEAQRMPLRMAEIRAGWATHRWMCLCMMVAGAIITMVGCMI